MEMKAYWIIKPVLKTVYRIFGDNDQYYVCYLLDPIFWRCPLSFKFMNIVISAFL